MNLMSPTELYAGLLFLMGTGIFMIVAMSKSSRALQHEIALRVQRSIAVIDLVEDGAKLRR